MASVDGARFVQGASDELYHCDPCKYEGQEKTATKLCQDCKEFLCKDCTDVHKKLTISRNHAVLPVDNISGLSYSVGKNCTILCENCQNVEVSDYCQQHHVVTCQTCRTVRHRKCNCTSVQERSRTYEKADLDQVKGKAKAMVDKLDKLPREKNDDLQNISSLKETYTEETKAYFEKVRKLLTLLEETILTELNKCAIQERQEIEHHLQVVSTTKELLQNDSKLLDDAKKSKTKEFVFAAAVKLSNRVKEYELLVEDISLERRIPLTSFTKNEQLKFLETKTKELETLTDDFIKGSKSKNALFTDIKLKKTDMVSVELPGDLDIPSITGCECTQDGKAILCDYKNLKVKFLDRSFKLIECLDLSSGPWDVTLVDSTRAIVTLPDEMQLQYIQLESSLKSGAIIEIREKCWGIKVAVEDIYVAVSCGECEGKIRVLDLKGQRKRTIKMKPSGSFLFQPPYYLTISATSGRLYCSDYHTNTVTCLNPDGSLVYLYKNFRLKSPGGMCVDAEENLITCGKSSNCIQIITPTGKIRQLNAVIERPVSLAYRPVDNALIVGCSETPDLAVLYCLTQ